MPLEGRNKMQAKLSKKNLQLDVRKFSLIIVLFVLIISLSIMSDRFLSLSNILNILTQVSINGVLATGMTFVILTGGIDLSVGSVLAIVGVVLATLKYEAFLSLVIALIIGAVIGALNGTLISKFKIQPFIVTLSSMTVFRGITYIATNGSPVSGLPDSLQFLGAGMLFDIVPIPVILLILTYIIGYIIMTNTKLGRYLFAIGDNEEATLNSGIDVTKYKTLAYTVSGMCAALSSVILTARLNSAQPNAGLSYELDAVAAVAIGGTSLSGGSGSLVGTFIGVLVLGIISNGLNLLNISAFYQQVIKGIIILVAVLIDKMKKD